jgi:Rab-GTPase-TBC domain
MLSSENWQEELRTRALDGVLGETNVRSIAWRAFLWQNELDGDEQTLLDDDDDRSKIVAKVRRCSSSASEWHDELSKRKEEYARLLGDYVVDPNEAEAVDDPLSQAESSVWNKYFENRELEQVIETDVVRTYPEQEFFRRKDIQEQMSRVLFLYARLYPKLSYRQGMHELLAPVLFLLHREVDFYESEAQDEAEEGGDGDRQFVNVFMQRDTIECEAFWLFLSIMDRAAPWFAVSPRGARGGGRFASSSSSSSSSSSTVDDVVAELNKTAAAATAAANGSDESGGGDDDRSQTMPVVRKCRYIQSVLLKKFDPQLETYLTMLGIEPQIYSLRWVRLLFGREFHLDDLLSLWDGLFAFDGASLSLIDYVAVAMLMFIRQDLLNMDNSSVLKRLFNFPPVESVHIFIERAINLKIGKKPATVQAVDDDDAVQDESDSAQAIVVDGGGAGGGESSPPPSPPAAAAAASQQQPRTLYVDDVAVRDHIDEQRREIERLRVTQQHMASRLERIIYVLQGEFVTATEDRQVQTDSVFLALAELKQVKDIGFGFLPFDAAADFLPPPKQE